MGSRKHVYRLVVDFWPTPDGKPFGEQEFQFWEKIADDYVNGATGDDLPDWLPDIGPWLVDDGPGSLGSPPPGHRVFDDDPPDRSTGYPGYPTYLMNVPAAPTRRFFTRNTVTKMRDVLIEWGCKAHIERAKQGDWEVSS